MVNLFPGETLPLPEGPDRITATWTTSNGDQPARREVTHASGYEPFVQLATDYGTAPGDLFDVWRFAHFIRAHAAAFAADRNLQHAAVVFLGNALASRHDVVWRHDSRGLHVETTEPWFILIDGEAVNNPRHRSAAVERIVEALLEADEQRFLEFHPTADEWNLPKKY